MSFNVKDGVEVSLEVFGGLVTELSPSDLPEGVSPACQDVVYTPGNVGTRAGVQRVFSSPFGSVTATYAKSYVLPNGVIKNLYLDSAGNLWVENFTASPNTYTLLYASSAPGSYAKSVTAFGREYIAISDGLHGSDIPLQYDGTNLDRVTQDGPGAPPNVSSFALPSVAMLATGGPGPYTITTCTPEDLQGGLYYSSFAVATSTALTGLNVGDAVTIASNSVSAFNGIWAVTAVYGLNLFVVSAYLPSGTGTGTGGTASTAGGVTMSRYNNLVSVTTTSPTFLQVGYQAQISGVPATVVGGGIAGITINNEDAPGIATIATNGPHGMVPGLFVSLTGVLASNVGTITTISRQGEVVTVNTSGTIKISPGSVVLLTGVTDPTFDDTYTVATVNGPTQFTAIQVNTTNATSTAGTVNLAWPVPDTANPTYFEVVSAPTGTTFQVEVNYSDGSWTGGALTYAWDGTFFVSNILDSTAFQYQQYGPNATTTSVGTVTPFGQAAPGKHQMRVTYLTRQGNITKPSPPVTFVANGGQYLSVSNIPIGPSNVTARILEFTGAEGSLFYYIPAPAQVNGQQVSTATQINDNTTTAILLDFSDNTLFAAIGTSIPGNDIASQIVLDGALGFGLYASRLLTYGQRNKIQTLLGMGFDSGFLPSAPTIPTGWLPADTSATGELVTGVLFGGAWKITVSPGGLRGNIGQSFYQDAYGAPIGTANSKYKIRVWLQPAVVAADVTFFAVISSASTGFNIQAQIPGSAMKTAGSWLEANFSGPLTAAGLAPDLGLFIYASSTATTLTLLVDELSVIYSDTPYTDTILFGSYVNNPEAFDGVSGKFGPADDTHKVMEFGIIRATLYLLTQEPSGRLHETSNNSVTEPAGWVVGEVAANCGALSTLCVTKSQADDNSASGGEEWLAWGSLSGARIFGGDQPWKISQEIQPNWEAMNPAALKTAWAINDPVARVIYFGLPTGTATAPNVIEVLNYRELDTSYQIAQSAPIRTALSGKLVATDNTRKWAPWNLPMNGAAMMYRQASQLSVVFFGGNGIAPGVGGFGNVYVLNPALIADQDYGAITSIYTTYFFPSKDAEQALQLGAHRKMLCYFQALLSGSGNVIVTPLVNALTNAWPIVATLPLVANPNYDLEWTGGSASGQRIAFRFVSTSAFQLSKMSVTLKPATHLPIRGAA